MAEEFLPITVFRQREIDETRVEGMGNKDKPKWCCQARIFTNMRNRSSRG